MEANNDKSRLLKLCKAIIKFEDAETCARFFKDLCTPSELGAMVGRWQVALMLEQKIPYRKINELTGVSTATITRVARFMENGHGGYKEALEMVNKNLDAT
ncbi:MAG: YerC/YecD family TrpR-related protein [Oligoflexales bacterium]